MGPTDARPRCATCRHAYTTWEASHPYGCRAYGFRSRQPPSDVVRRSSGMECQLHEPRLPRPRAADRRRG